MRFALSTFLEHSTIYPILLKTISVVLTSTPHFTVTSSITLIKTSNPQLSNVCVICKQFWNPTRLGSSKINFDSSRNAQVCPKCVLAVFVPCNPMKIESFPRKLLIIHSITDQMTRLHDSPEQRAWLGNKKFWNWVRLLFNVFDLI